METKIKIISLGIASVLVIAQILNFTQLIVFSQPLPSSTPIAGTDLNYRNGWYGNTHSGINDRAIAHSIDAIAVDPTTGSVYTNTHWEEGGMQVSQFRNGELVKYMPDTFGWGRAGGHAVAVNSQYIWGAIVYGGDDACAQAPGELNTNGLLNNRLCGTTWTGFARYKNTLIQGNAYDAEFAPFPTGYATGSYLLIDPNNTETHRCNPSGALATETELFVSDYCNDKIRVYDAESMVFLREFNVLKPGKLTMDKQGNLWVLSLKDDPGDYQIGDFRYTYSDTIKILRYTTSGTKLPQELSGPSVRYTRGLAVNSRNDLLVAIGGEADRVNAKQQIFFYNDINNNPTFYKTFGEEGGYYGGAIKGQVKDGKFDWITGLGVDAQDNIYISMQKIGVASYKEDGTKNWQVSGMMFVDSAAVDPRNPNISYTRWDKFEFDPNRPDGVNWKHLARTYDFKEYPGDARNWFLGGEFGAVPLKVCYVGDTKFLVMNVFSGIAGYRFDYQNQGEIAIPAFEIHPGDNAEPETFVWVDKNGDGAVQTDEKTLETNEIDYIYGFAVDEQCGIWLAQQGKAGNEDNITHYKATALEVGGFSPNYSVSTKVRYKTPPEVSFQEFYEPTYTFVGGILQKLQYDVAQDTMYIAGFDDVNIQNAGDPRLLGNTLYKYTNWSNPTLRQLAWQVEVPHPSNNGIEKYGTNLTLSGDYLMVGEFRGDYGQFLYNKNTGQRFDLSSLVQGDFRLGWIDIAHGGVLLNKRPDGTYLATVEDDHFSKMFTYYFKPNSLNSMVTGSLFSDINNNNNLDSGENGENLPIGTKLKLTSTSNANQVFYPIINTAGDFAQPLPAGNYSIQYELANGYFASDLAPTSITVNAQEVADINPIPINTQPSNNTHITPKDIYGIPIICGSQQQIVLPASGQLNFQNNIPTTSCYGTLPNGVTLDPANPLKLKIGNVGVGSLNNSNRLESNACSINGNTFTCTNTPIGSMTGTQEIFFKIGENASLGNGYGGFVDSLSKVNVYPSDVFADGDITFVKGTTGQTTAFNNILHKDWRTGNVGNEARIILNNFRSYTNIFPTGNNLVCQIAVRPAGSTSQFSKLIYDTSQNNQIDQSENSVNIPYNTSSNNCTGLFTSSGFVGGQPAINSATYNWEVKIEVLDTAQSNKVVGTFYTSVGFKFAAIIIGG